MLRPGKACQQQARAGGLLVGLVVVVNGWGKGFWGTGGETGRWRDNETMRRCGCPTQSGGARFDVGWVPLTVGLVVLVRLDANVQQVGLRVGCCRGGVRGMQAWSQQQQRLDSGGDCARITRTSRELGKVLVGRAHDILLVLNLQALNLIGRDASKG